MENVGREGDSCCHCLCPPTSLGLQVPLPGTAREGSLSAARAAGKALVPGCTFLPLFLKDILCSACLLHQVSRWLVRETEEGPSFAWMCGTRGMGRMDGACQWTWFSVRRTGAGGGRRFIAWWGEDLSFPLSSCHLTLEHRIFLGLPASCRAALPHGGLGRASVYGKRLSFRIEETLKTVGEQS